MKKLPSLKRVNELLSFDPETGVFTWNEKPCRGWRKGDDLTAGRVLENGYIRIVIDRENYMAHRLAWLVSTGREPYDQIDHINGNRADNRIANLREATGSENQQNHPVHVNNASGYPGVSFNRRKKKWKAQIKVKGNIRHLGWHDDPKDAASAYHAAKAEHHKFCPEVRSS